MEKSLPLGPEGSLVLKLVDGKVVVSAQHNHASGSAKFEVSEDAGYFMDKLKAIIPGTIDDAVIDILKGALKAL